jgi:hypothetical protein
VNAFILAVFAKFGFGDSDGASDNLHLRRRGRALRRRAIYSARET